jgi:hypothetical protein
VNAIHPGLVDTPMITMPLHNKLMIEMTPMGRAAQPEEIASLVLFLGSDESVCITGADIAIDGGYSAGAVMRGMSPWALKGHAPEGGACSRCVQTARAGSAQRAT